MSDPIRVRIAPSPTGTVHLGLARSALFNWGYARGRGGKFLLRIEDTDKARNTEESLHGIIEGLRWLGIEWDEGPDIGGPFEPYYQSEREERHMQRAQELLASGAAYRCFHTPEELEAKRAEKEARPRDDPRGGAPIQSDYRDLDPAEAAQRAESEPYAVRFRIPEGRTEFTDLVRGDVGFDNAEIEDWIMVRRGGGPTYNFVVVCDDADMQISHVFRGEEHLTNTPKQVLLYQALGLEPPQFGHLPLLLGKNKKKLSKRDGGVSLDDYRREGYPREAIINFLCLQGWALDGENDLFTVEQFVEAFDIADVSKGGSVFDVEKFQWMAGEYTRALAVPELADRCAPFVVAAGQMTDAELSDRTDWYRRVVAEEQERIRLYSELPARIAHYFADDDSVEYEPKAEKGARKRDGRVETLTAYAAWLRERGAIGDVEELGAATKEWISARELKIPELFQPLRCALTGMGGGADLFVLMDLIGFERTLARIEAGTTRLA